MGNLSVYSLLYIRYITVDQTKRKQPICQLCVETLKLTGMWERSKLGNDTFCHPSVSFERGEAKRNPTSSEAPTWYVVSSEQVAPYSHVGQPPGQVHQSLLL